MPRDLINDRTPASVRNPCSHSELLGQARQIFTDIFKKTKMVGTATVVDQLLLTNRKNFSNDTKWRIDRFYPCTVSTLRLSLEEI